MFYKNYLESDIDKDIEADANDVDALLPADPDTDEGLEKIADEVEDALQRQALESCTYFDGGEEAVNNFMESAEIQAYMEAFPFGAGNKKRTFVHLSRNDDLKRRISVASISIAKAKKDPLFDKWARTRIKERNLRKLIYKKYQKAAYKAAKISQKKHVAERKKFPSLPFFGKKDKD